MTGQGRALLWAEIAALIAVWVALVMLVDPRGDFPLNDDWSYARTVEIWQQTGQFAPINWTSMPLLSHAAWGLLFAEILGPGFEPLRLSVLVASGLGLICLILALAELSVSPGWRLFIALSVGVSPLWFALSFSFMTDVPFAALMVASALFYLRFLRSRGIADLTLATLLAAAAVLSRQLGLALPLGVFLALAILRRRGWMDLVLGAASLTICVWIYLGFNGWLEGTGRTPALYGVKTLELGRLWREPLGFARDIAATLLALLVYLGLMILPAVLALRGGGRRVRQWALGLFLGGVAAVAILYRQALPVLGNTLEPWGFGPRVLADSFLMGLPNLPDWPAWAWLAATGAGLAGMAMMGARVIAGAWRRADWRSEAALALCLTVAAYLAVVAPTALVFDRYVIALTPLAVLALVALSPATAGNPARRAAAAVALTLTAAVSVGGVHDYLNWNRAKWRAIDHAAGLGIGADRIDAGFSYHGMVGYVHGFEPPPGLSWWWVRDDSYMLASGPVPGYRELAEFPYRNLLPWQTRAVRLLERADLDPATDPATDALNPGR